jgi:anti-sigma factor RsiW
MTAPQASAVCAHLAACPECALLAAQLNAVVDALHRLGCRGPR